MHILLTGATGYIGKRLLPVLLEQGHTVTCCVRDPLRFRFPENHSDRVQLYKTDFSQAPGPELSLNDVDAAYYLIHSMTGKIRGYSEWERNTARHFCQLAEKVKCRQVIYLSGISNDEELSEHLESRKAVESVLQEGPFSTTILRAGIIVGSGSASFEIIRDLVEKLPVMIAPKWINTRCQPIAVRNVIEYLTGVLGNERTYNQTFDIGGPDILTYKKMMLEFASVRGLKRKISSLPVMTPRLSSYWLYFVTSTNYALAVNLVDSMKVEVVCQENRLQQLLKLNLFTYKEAVQRAFGKIDQNMVVSSWIDSLKSGPEDPNLQKYMKVPEHGCLIDQKTIPLKKEPEKIFKKIWSIGGNNGWYYANYLWRIRGILDKLFGGVGLRRGRTNQTELHSGDALDFWRVLVADRKEKRLLLYAEMKLPGEAWLEFHISENRGKPVLMQTATFRPKGISGRVYWYLIGPFHFFVFSGMAKAIARG